MPDACNCQFCECPTGPHDEQSMIDGAGVYCGGCTRRMGIDHDLILSCGLCRFPILGYTGMIDGHDCEYCETCLGILTRMGF